MDRLHGRVSSSVFVAWLMKGANLLEGKFYTHMDGDFISQNGYFGERYHLQYHQTRFYYYSNK